MKRREFLGVAGAAFGALAFGTTHAATRRKPNFIVILCDDLGYGDVQPTGGKLIRTPNIQRMADQGTVLTDYYAPANLCTPSRAGLLTGRYPIRTGLAYGVILQNDTRGLPLSEVTIAEALKPAGYVSGLFGKWHLGHIAPFWPPTRQGFDLFFGLPYSHDMKPLSLYEDNGPGVELTKEDVDFPKLQQRFYERAERFIEANADKPFFVELALSAPHLPSHPHHDFDGQSPAGSYGDVVNEIDSIVGRLTAKLKALGLDRDTLVILTSDNGPWYEGSSGGLRSRKGGGGFDGGYRVPFIACQPGVVRAGKRVNSIAMGIDLLPTFCAMAGLPNPAGVQLDGLDISRLLTTGGGSPHDELVLFSDEDVEAIRTQRWKYVIAEFYRTYHSSTEGKGYPQLYDLELDPTESYSVAARHPDVLADMQRRLERARATFGPMKAKEIPEPYRKPAENSPRVDRHVD